MRAFKLAVIATCIGICLEPTSALACSVVISHEPSPSERRREAQDTVERATAIVDGEVLRPITLAEPALVRVTRVLKGETAELILVGERDSCDIALTQTGQRLRLILVGGPEIFFLPVDYSNAVYEDRLIGSDRRRDWPYQQGH